MDWVRKIYEEALLEEITEVKLIPVLKTNGGEDGFNIELDEDALKTIFLRPKVVNKPVMLLSVSGAFRKGKSFLLNFLLRYLRNKGYENEDWLGTDEINDGFKWKGGKEPQTKGILIFNEPFIIKKEDTEIAVLLMDTQGLFDNNSDKKLCTQIFAFSTLLSSVQVFNLSQQIQENDLEYLQCFTEYARVAQSVKSEGAPFQKLMFIIRDWQELDDHEYGLDVDCNEDGVKGYLAGVLSCISNNAELMSVRNHLKSSFSDLQCFLMPHPGLKVAVTRPGGKTFNGSLKDISPDFLRYVTVLANSLLSPQNLIPKKIHGSIISGNSLVNYAIACSRTFASGNLPEPKTMLKSASDCMNIQVMNSCLDQYSTNMNRTCEVYLDEEELKQEDEKNRKIVIDWFDIHTTFGNKEGNLMFREKLVDLLRQNFEVYRSRNYALGREIRRNVREFANRLVKEYVWTMEAKTKDRALHDDVFQACHRTTFSGVVEQFVANKKNLVGFSDSLEILKSDCIFAFEVLRPINAQKWNLEIDQKKSEQLKVHNLIQQFVDVYKEQMGKFFGCHLQSRLLRDKHTDLTKTLSRKFQSESEAVSRVDKNKYLDQLSAKFEEEFKEVEAKNEMNKKMLELILSQKLAKSVEGYRFVMFNGMKDNYILPKVLEELHTKNENSLVEQMMQDDEVRSLSYDSLTDPTVRESVEDLRSKLRNIYEEILETNEKNRGVFLKTTTGFKSFFHNVFGKK